MSKKNAKQKAVKVPLKSKNNDLVKNLDGKKCYMKLSVNSNFLDCNTIGDIYMSFKETNKWEFIKTDFEGAYLIKHTITGLYLTSNQKGDLFGSVDLDTTFQKWYVIKTDTDTVYAYQNACNELFLEAEIRGKIYLAELSEPEPKDGIIIGSPSAYMATFQFFPKK